jgi:prevent-host-death family protein
VASFWFRALVRLCFPSLHFTELPREGGLRLGWTVLETATILIVVITMIMEVNMITEVSAVKFRQNLGEMLNQVQYRKDAVVVTRDGKPVAALIDAEQFERIRRMREQFDEIRSKIAEDFRDVPEEVGMAQIEAAIAEVRGKK